MIHVRTLSEADVTAVDDALPLNRLDQWRLEGMLRGEPFYVDDTLVYLVKRLS